MKKFFIFLCMLGLSVQFAIAQKTLYILSTDGELSALEANKVTFGNNIFTFTYGDVTEITNGSITSSFSVELTSKDSVKYTPEVGICYSDMNENPTISDGKIRIYTHESSTTEYNFSIYGLDSGTIYYYRAYVKINDAVYYGDVCHETTSGEKPNYIIINGHKFVDLGLPSGILWATCNIGAVTSAEIGNSYAWGETEQKSNSLYSYNKFFRATLPSRYFKYNDIDAKVTLDKEDDVAYINWGDSCRMPTKEEVEELTNSNNCIWLCQESIDRYGSLIMGFTIYSKTNNNTIFLPASWTSKWKYGTHCGGTYWSSTRNSKYIDSAHILEFDNSSESKPSRTSYHSRSNGYYIRAVAEP